jgi:2-polyprenyl-3-methyl-5-hydroxy-6-metoxy-1,4-benzoquinol methylase
MLWSGESESNVDPEYIQEYRTLYTKHWWWRAREEAIVSTLRHIQPAGGFGHILDVGCGDGLLFDRLLEFGEPEGIEPDASMLSSRSPHRARIHVCPFDETFRSDKQYGLILMLDVLEHLSNAVTAVAKVRSLLRPGGMFLATVPAFQLLWTNHDVINHHVRRYTRKTLQEVIEAGGMLVNDEQYWFNWLFVPKLTARVIESVFHTQPKNPRIPPDWLNRCLYLFSRIENRALGRFPIPFGSSLMALAHKTQTDASEYRRIRGEVDSLRV